MPDRLTLERWARAALYFTMAAALLYGLVWIVHAVMDEPPGWIDGTDAVVFAMLMIGGVAMGVLYLLRRVSTD